MCKEVLFLLEHKTLGNTEEKCARSSENVDSHAKKWGTKPLFNVRPVFARKVELGTTCILAELYKDQRKYNEAKELFIKALKIALETGHEEGTAECYDNLGSIFKSLGEYVEAKEHYEKALAIAEKIGDRETEAKCNGNLGSIFHSLGEYVNAQEYYEKALAIAGKIGHRERESYFYTMLVCVFLHLGEYVKAKEHSEKALAIAGLIGHREQESKCYTDLGDIFVFLDDYVKAKEHYEKALAIAEKAGDREQEASCYARLGNIFHRLGDHVRALDLSEKALAIAQKTGKQEEIEAQCHGNLGWIFFCLGEYVKAKECFDKVLELSRKLGKIHLQSCTYLALSLCMLKLGNIYEGNSNIFASINKSEVIRRLQVQEKYKISHFDHVVEEYRLASDFLSNFGFLYEAFYIEEYGRARTLADLMAARYSEENEISVTPQRWDDIESIVKKECNCTCLYISYYRQSINFWVLKAESPLLFRKINIKNFFDGKGSVSRVTDWLCRKIYKEVLCLPPEQCEDRSWLPSDAYSEYGCERPIVEDDEGKNQQPDRTPAYVYKMIIAPVADLLDEPEIIIVPDRLFYKVPFAALEEKSGKCLSESFRIRIVPSLTTLKLIQDSPAGYHSQTGVLIVGDPHVGEVLYNGILRQISRLPFASEEAKMIGKLFGTEPLVGKQATKQAVLQNIHSVSLIHFACHGNAERGEIVLAPPRLTDRRPQEEDYLLAMENISQVQLRAKLVVLSCCHSAKGHISAEGVVGIARAFLGSGARSVLAALWAIEDEATEQFMSRFYENLVRGNSASESLQQAMNWMRENGFAKITQWAPFMLIGDNVTLDVHKLRLTEGQ